MCFRECSGRHGSCCLRRCFRGRCWTAARGVPVATAPLRVGHVLLLGTLAVQQALASISAVEVEPLLSNYSMYSSTFESPEAFERARYRKMQRLRFTVEGADVSARVQAIQNASENLLDAAEDIAAGQRIREQVMTPLLGGQERVPGAIRH